MSTNLAPPSPDELLLSGEGPANVWQTATNRKKVMKDRKREAHNQELYRQLLQQRQVKQTLEKQPEVQPSSQPQVKLFSLAMTALDTFAQAKVNAINARNEVRPRVTAIIDGIKIDLLYDTGAMSSCLSPATYERHFSHKKLSNDQNVSASAAGNVDLGVQGSAVFEVSVRGATLKHEFLVCQRINDDIMSIGLANQLEISYNACTRQLCAIAPVPNSLVLHQQTLIPAQSAAVITTKFRGSWNPNTTYVATLHNPRTGFVVGGPALVTIDDRQFCDVAVFNAAPFDIVLEREDFMGAIEEVPDSTTHISSVNTIPVAALSHRTQPPPLQPQDLRGSILEQTPSDRQEELLQILLQFPSVLQRPAGHHPRLPQDTRGVNYQEPLYQKQGKIPQAHRPVIEETLDSWIRLGLIRKADSMFNTPLFCLQHPDGYRIVQDFRALNRKQQATPIKFKEIHETLHDLETSKPKVFSTLDLSDLAWQMNLSQEQAAQTAFTVPGRGQFQWNRTPLGVLGAQAAFHRLLTTVLTGLPDVLVHIDRVIIYSQHWDHHLKTLRQALSALQKHGLTINLQKSQLGTDSADVMGFRIAQGHIHMAPTQIEVARHWEPPTDAKMIRSFLGLTNFFRGHIRDYANIAAPLNRLLRKGSQYSGGPMPDDAAEAFQRLKRILCSAPILTMPEGGKQYALIVDASTGAHDFEGGLGAILTQIDSNNRFAVIAYASRLLSKEEKQFSPFLLEMRAMVWATRYFQGHLQGQRFILFTDHKPLQTCADLPANKTLTELQQLALEFDFIIQHKKGINMPADFLSRSNNTFVVNAIQLTPRDLADQQGLDPEIRALKDFRATRRWPDYLPSYSRHAMQQLEPNFTTDIHRRFWVKTTHKGLTRNLLYAPSYIRKDLLHEAHGNILAGHSAIERTMDRIKTSWWWPSLKLDVANHIRRCTGCQKTKKSDTKPAPLAPLPIPDGPNIRIHADLFGPLKSNSGNKHVLCMTDAFTKIAVVVPIPDKEATTVASNILHHWIYRFAAPEQIHTDGGKEFCNKLSDELWALWNIKRTKTTPAHPQCNAQVENFNKRIKEYLAPYIYDDSLDWEKFLPAMNFAYNTSYHSTIGTTPFQLLYGYPADTPGTQNKTMQPEPTFETHLSRAQWLSKLRVEAKLHSENQKLIQKRAYDKHASVHNFKLDQEVLVRVHDFLNKNRKLATKFEGPFRIVELNQHYAVLKSPKGKPFKRNILHLKPYFPPDSTTPLPSWAALEQGEEAQDANQNDHINLAYTVNLIFNDQHCSKRKLDTNQKLINAINTEWCNQRRPYLLELALKVLTNQDQDVDPLTSKEREIWNSFSRWERSVILTGSPLGMPEWRTDLCAMPGPSTPAPANNNPAPPGPVHQPAILPPPNPNPGPARSRRGPRPPPPPSDRTLRSKGPASHGLLPESTRTRTRTTTSTTTAPSSTDTARARTSPTSVTPTTENSQPPVSTAQSSSWPTWGLGFMSKLLPGGGAEADEPDIANIDQVNQQTDGDDSSELEDICSFF